jgi:hypothetical protein
MKWAKQKNMKKRAHVHVKHTGGSGILSNGAGLPRGTLLYRRLRSALDNVARRQFGYEDLADLIDEPKSTLCNWNNGDGQPGAETLLKLLELLPETERSEIFRELPFCRHFPNLEHPRIAHDPIAVSYLRSALRSEKGITMVYGERDSLNTFVATAMAHSFSLSAGLRGQITGLDIHTPDWFVPVPGVLYLNNTNHLVGIRAEAEKIWCGLTLKACKIVLLNGIWAAGPEWKLKICDMAQTRHVIVTDILKSKTAPPPALPSPGRLVLTAPDVREPNRIRIEVQFL